MKYPHLIILYGRFGNQKHNKQQDMIDGKSVCGYRGYAKRFGEIIYLCPQDTKETWDRSITNNGELLRYLLSKPNSIIWSVKHDPTQQKDRILEQLHNKKVYYSCCANDTINMSCDISLVDTCERVKGNGVVWVKGKDPDFWKPLGNKKDFDYCMIGKRGDKNELWFINQLTERVKEKRSVLWIGGAKHSKRLNPTHHRVVFSDFTGPEGVRNWIDRCKVGVLLSDIPAEGFPQSFLEMTMMGLPVVYMGPVNNCYLFENVNMIYGNKNFTSGAYNKHAVIRAEIMLELLDANYSNCRRFATERYSLEKSYDSILEGLK